MPSSMSTEIVRGVWKRQWEEDPLGDVENADRTTLVLWTQAPKSGIYVDLRLPQGSPGRSGSTSSVSPTTTTPTPIALQARGMDASMLSPEQVQIVLQQKSFAGVLEYSVGDTTSSGKAIQNDAILAKLAQDANRSNNSGDGALGLCTCFWKRIIDYQPPTGGLDVGVCASKPPNEDDGSIDLRETGEDASYAEGWHRLPGSHQGPVLACELRSEDAGERAGFWVRTGNFFAYAIGRPKDAETAKQLGCSEISSKVQDCVGKSLADATGSLVAKEDVGAQLNTVGCYVCVTGEIDNGGNWKILHSTDPRLVGCTLVGDDDSSCSSVRHSSSGGPLQAGSMLTQVVAGGVSRVWQVKEVDGSVGIPSLE